MTSGTGMRDPHRRFRLGEWLVSPMEGLLVGEDGQRRLQPRQMDVLMALVERAGTVVTREELLRDLWGGRAMTDEPLTRCVAELRQQLGDSRAEPRYIQTIPKRGYRLVAECAWEEGGEQETAADVGPEEVSASDIRERVDGTASAGAETTSSAAAPPSPAARTRTPWLVATIAIVLIAGAGLWLAREHTTSNAHAATVAVLPFTDLSPSADQQYFADGVHEEIITRLSSNPALEVISRTSVMPYRGSKSSAREIGAALGAGAIIEGSVRYADGRVRVTAQLIDATTDTHLWAENFDRELTLQSLFAIQSEIAERVADGLQARFDAAQDGAAATKLPTRDLQAYDEFLLGKYHYRKLQPEDLRASVQHLERAVERDPAFAEAWDWLAYAWNHSGTEQGWTTPRDAYPRAQAAAVHALELDPKLATSRALLGYLRAVYDWDWAGGLAELEQAMKQDPSDTGTVWSYAYVLSVIGQHDRAVALTSDLARASPNVGRVQLELAYRLNDAQRYADAKTTAQRSLELGAETGLAYDVLGMANLGLGDVEAAVSAFEQAADVQRRAPDILGHLAFAYARAGREEDARALLEELKTRGNGVYVSPLVFADIAAGLGERDTAFDMLEQAATERVRGVLSVAGNPIFADLRGDARMDALLKQTGLPAAATPR